MRKLTSLEIEKIHARLKSLRIQYTEVYEEVFDHYCTTLENSPAIDSSKIIAKLNDTFAWTVVRHMDKSHERFTKKLITQMQWDELKFWKVKNHNMPYLALTMMILALVYIYLDVVGMILMAGVFSLLCIPIVWYSIGKDVSFSIKQFHIKSSKAFANQLINRSGICYSGLSYLFIAYANWNNSNPGVVGTILTWLVITPLLLYMITLVRVAWHWKLKQMQIISQ